MISSARISMRRPFPVFGLASRRRAAAQGGEPRAHACRRRSGRPAVTSTPPSTAGSTWLAQLDRLPTAAPSALASASVCASASGTAETASAATTPCAAFSASRVGLGQRGQERRAGRASPAASTQAAERAASRPPARRRARSTRRAPPPRSAGMRRAPPELGVALEQRRERARARRAARCACSAPSAAATSRRARA